MKFKTLAAMALTMGCLASKAAPVFPEVGSTFQRGPGRPPMTFGVFGACPAIGADGVCTLGNAPTALYNVFSCNVLDCDGVARMVGWIPQARGNFQCVNALLACADYVLNWRGATGRSQEWEWTNPIQNPRNPPMCNRNPPARPKNPRVPIQIPHKNCPCPNGTESAGSRIPYIFVQ